MLGRRRRRRASIDATLGQRLLFAGQYPKWLIKYITWYTLQSLVLCNLLKICLKRTGTGETKHFAI